MRNLFKAMDFQLTCKRLVDELENSARAILDVSIYNSNLEGVENRFQMSTHQSFTQ